MKRIVYLLLVVVVLAGCKSSKRLVTSETKAPVSSYLASKLQLTIPDKKGGSLSVGGTMRMKTHERGANLFADAYSAYRGSTYRSDS